MPINSLAEYDTLLTEDPVGALEPTKTQAVPDVEGYSPAKFLSSLESDPVGALEVANSTPRWVYPKPDRGLGGKISSGVYRGFSQLGQMAAGVGIAGAEAVGVPRSITQPAVDVMQNAAAFQAENNPAEVPTLKDIHGVGDFLTYATEQVATQLPVMAPTVISAILSGGVSAPITAMGERIAAEGVAKGLTKEAASKLANKAIARAILKKQATAAFVPAMAMNAGETEQELIERGQRGPGTAALALGTGAVKGALDIAEPLLFLTRTFGKQLGHEVVGSLVKRLGKETATQFLVEGSTEGAQGLLDEAAKMTKDPTYRPSATELADTFLENAIAGGLVGGVMGSVSAIPGGVRGEQGMKTDTAQPDTDQPRVEPGPTQELTRTAETSGEAVPLKPGLTPSAIAAAPLFEGEETGTPIEQTETPQEREEAAWQELQSAGSRMEVQEALRRYEEAAAEGVAAKAGTETEAALDAERERTLQERWTTAQTQYNEINNRIASAGDDPAQQQELVAYRDDFYRAMEILDRQMREQKTKSGETEVKSPSPTTPEHPTITPAQQRIAESFAKPSEKPTTPKQPSILDQLWSVENQLAVQFPGIDTESKWDLPVAARNEYESLVEQRNTLKQANRDRLRTMQPTRTTSQSAQTTTTPAILPSQGQTQPASNLTALRRGVRTAQKAVVALGNEMRDRNKTGRGRVFVEEEYRKALANLEEAKRDLAEAKPTSGAPRTMETESPVRMPRESGEPMLARRLTALREADLANRTDEVAAIQEEILKGLDSKPKQRAMRRIIRDVRSGAMDQDAAVILEGLFRRLDVDPRITVEVVRAARTIAEEEEVSLGEPQAVGKRVLGSTTPQITKTGRVTSALIRLFQGHNATTAIHEIYHASFDLAPRYVRLKAARHFLGDNGIQSWERLGEQQQAQVHEAVAEAGTSYFFRERTEALPQPVKNWFQRVAERIRGFLRGAANFEEMPAELSQWVRDVADGNLAKYQEDLKAELATIRRERMTQVREKTVAAWIMRVSGGRGLKGPTVGRLGKKIHSEFMPFYEGMRGGRSNLMGIRFSPEGMELDELAEKMRENETLAPYFVGIEHGAEEQEEALNLLEVLMEKGWKGLKGWTAEQETDEDARREEFYKQQTEQENEERFQIGKNPLEKQAEAEERDRRAVETDMFGGGERAKLEGRPVGTQGDMISGRGMQETLAQGALEERTKGPMRKEEEGQTDLLKNEKERFQVAPRAEEIEAASSATTPSQGAEERRTRRKTMNTIESAKNAALADDGTRSGNWLKEHPEVQEAYGEASKPLVVGGNWIQRQWRSLRGFAQSTRGAFPHLETSRKALLALPKEELEAQNRLVEELRRQKNYKNLAAENAVKWQQDTVLEPLATPDLAQRKKNLGLFQRAVVVRNMVYEAERKLAKFGVKGLYQDFVGFEDEIAKIALPFNWTMEWLRESHQLIESDVRENGQVAQALQNRDALFKKMAQELVREDLLDPEQAKNPHYYHQIVLEYALGADMAELIGPGGRLKIPEGRSYQKHRYLNAEAYSADVLKVDNIVLSQFMLDILNKRLIDRIGADPVWKAKKDWVLKEAARRTEELQKKYPQARPVTMGDVLEDLPGYTIWAVHPGMKIFGTTTLRNELMAEVVQRVMGLPAGAKAVLYFSKEDLAQGARGLKYDWYVLPQEIAAQLNDMANAKFLGTPNEISNMIEPFLNAWKQGMLFTPTRTVRYNINNTMGDLEGVMEGAGLALLRGKEVWKKTFGDLWEYFKTGKKSMELREAIEGGVLSGTITAGEVRTGLRDIPGFEAFYRSMEGENATAKTTARQVARLLYKVSIGWGKSASVFREGILRYKAYLYAREILDKGGTMGKELPFAASRSVEFEGLKPKQAAAKWARELLGDYDAISAFGQMMRKGFFPFFSWTEVNLKRYKRLFENAFVHGEGTWQRKVLLGTAPARKLAMGLLIWTLGVDLWNWLMLGDDDEAKEGMSKYVKQRGYLAIGPPNAEHEVKYIRVAGASRDLMEWVGMGQWPDVLADLKSGQTSVGEALLTIPKSAANKLVGGGGPAKSLIELAFGKTLFPDMFEPKAIREKDQFFAQMWGLDEEYKWAKNLFSPVPRRGAGDYIMNLLAVKSNDPGLASYNEAVELKFRFEEKVLNKFGSAGDASSEKSTLARQLRLARRWGDERAEERIQERLAEMGVRPKEIREMLERAKPLYGLSRANQRAFLDWLTPEQRRTLERAETYYQETFR